jgi:hypothetical protein
MIDVWYTYPAQMEEHRAYITYNHGYADIAEKDDRDFLLSLKVDIRASDPASPSLSDLDRKIRNELEKSGAIYVGRITVDGYRYYHFYVNVSEDVAEKPVGELSEQVTDSLVFRYESDPDKDAYWKELYPSADDWQVIKDLEVLEILSQNGDKPDKERTVSHWASFPNQSATDSFTAWLKSNGYTIIVAGDPERRSTFDVRFQHIGTMELEDITSHTVDISRTVRVLKGDYDGWETSVEK